MEELHFLRRNPNELKRQKTFHHLSDLSRLNRDDLLCCSIDSDDNLMQTGILNDVGNCDQDLQNVDESGSTFTSFLNSDSLNTNRAGQNILYSPKPSRLSWHTARRVNILVVKIFESADSDIIENLSANEVGTTTAERYQLADTLAANYDVKIIEQRRDLFVYMGEDCGQTSPSVSTADDSGSPVELGKKMGRMLALASDLHARLSLTSSGGARLAVGMAYGAATLLWPSASQPWAPICTLRVRGDAVCVAEEMAGLGAVGAVTVHESALWRWAATARQPPPPSTEYSCAGGERRRAATFDLSTLSFHPPSTSPPTAHVPRRLTRSSSYS